jgi:hypothetical protein
MGRARSRWKASGRWTCCRRLRVNRYAEAMTLVREVRDAAVAMGSDRC